MICYKNKKKQQSLDVFQAKGSDDLIIYIKLKDIRCKVDCSFDTGKAVLREEYKRRKYTEEQFNKIQELLSYKFDFELVR